MMNQAIMNIPPKKSGVRVGLLLAVIAIHAGLLFLFARTAALRADQQKQASELTLPVPLKMVMVDVITTPAPIGNTLDSSAQAMQTPVSLLPPNPRPSAKSTEPQKNAATTSTTKAEPEASGKQTPSHSADSASAPSVSTSGQQVATTPLPTVGQGGKGEGGASKSGGEHVGPANDAIGAKSASGEKSNSGASGAFSAAHYGAAYLNNPAPQYPPLSRRLGEQGKVLLRVLVSAEGLAKDVLIHASSGSKLLDQAALKAVRRWRFVPAKQGDLAVTAWVQVPIVFQLNQGESR